MSIKTTVIGSYPKPEYLNIPDWRNTDVSVFVKEFMRYTKEKGKLDEIAEYRGVKEVVKVQVEAGVDFPTDGEVRRGDYISYHCTHLCGVDSDELEELSCRGGAYSYWAPVVRSKITPKQHFLTAEVKMAELLTDFTSFKVTLPGPTTVRDTIKNNFYTDVDEYLNDLAEALNHEIRHLAAHGVKHIQVDEPVFARNPTFAKEKGLKYLNRCFEGIKDAHPDVTTYVHICCGYPSSLDNEKEYTRADPRAYYDLLEIMDAPENHFDFICLEDAHRQNDLTLFSHFKNKGLVLGTIAIASTAVESVQSIAERVEEVKRVLPSRRLMVSPDCGMMMLPATIAQQKLKNMCEAVRIVNAKDEEEECGQEDQLGALA
eukprot:TRINITY_DN13439_c0_g1_i1.p1 TRINITY_DN13439_c0_g1~~TRINITY_DN13439_c0_g1_i1.p1  ORF type:complete len:398 (+),score=83.22 TRINITY_DN13439_c0_g1_i1:78-1196(+)